MTEIIIDNAVNLLKEVVVVGAGAFFGACFAVKFGYKKSRNEELGAQVIERKMQLYDELLNVSFKIRLNRKMLFNDKYLTGLFSLTPRCRVLAEEEVQSKYQEFFDYLVGLRTEYSEKNEELEKQFYCWVPACDYYDTDDTDEIQVPQYSGADLAYDRAHQALRESILPKNEKLGGLLDGLSGAISFDLNR